MIVILNANAVIDPGAMMIKAFNTLITDGAMPRARSADDHTLGAEIRGVKFLKQL